MIPKHDAAWLACAFDAEGSLAYWRPGRKTGFVVRLSLYNTDKRFMRKAQSCVAMITGKVPRVLRKATGFGHPATKPCYALHVSAGADVRVILDVLLPYLIVKAEKARQVLPWLVHRAGRRGNFTDRDKRMLQRLFGVA